MSKKPLFIYCDGGFGNRLFSLVSGVRLAYLFRRQPEVIWPCNNWCELAFEEIFKSNLKSHQDYHLEDLLSERRNLNILHENFFDKSLFWLKAKRPLVFLLAANQLFRGSVFFSTNRLERYARSPGFLRDFFGGLNFNDAILSKAADVLRPVLAKYGSYKCLHIRRTDFPEQKPLGIYLKIVEDYPDDIFFICSDDHITESKFHDYPNVFFHDKKYYTERLVEGDWNTQVFDRSGNSFPFNVNRTKCSVRDSIVDLIILSNGNLELNPYTRSSFLAVAKLLSVYSRPLCR